MQEMCYSDAGLLGDRYIPDVLGMCEPEVSYVQKRPIKQGRREQEMVCPRCKKDKDSVRFMWDLMIDGKQELCVEVCEECDEEIRKK